MIINLICRQLARRGLVQSHILPNGSQWTLHSRIACFFSRDETDDKDREARPRRQFFQKHTNRDGQFKQNIRNEKGDISMILKSYRLAVPNTRNHNEIFSESCKKLSSHYRQETHEEYVGQKDELNKILTKIPQLDFQTMTLIELLNILDFLRITTRIEGLNRSAVDKDKEVLFGIINRYIKENPSLPLSEVFIIFCKLTPLNYPDIHYMAELVLEHLQKEMSKTGKLPFPPFQHYVMVKALSKKTFLSFKDKQILQIIIKDLAKLSIYDKKLSISLFKALVDLNVKTHIADHELLKIINSLLDGYLAELDGLRNIFMLKYLTECSVNECTQYYNLIKILYSRLLTKAEAQFTTDLLDFMINVIKHLKPSDITRAHQKFLISKIIELHGSGTRRQCTKLQFQIVELVNVGFLREQIHHLNQLIEKPSFQFSWTLPYTYSQAGLKFLPGKMVEKGDRASTFRENANFAKTAVSIAIQSRLQPQNAELKALHEKVIANIKESTWTTPGYNWLSHVGAYHPEAVRTFVKQYGHLFNDKIVPEKSLIQQNFNLKIGSKINLLSYWQYFFLVNQFDENCPSQLIFSLSVAPISLCIVRQYNKTKLMADKKSLLLASLYVKLNQCQQADPSSHDLEFCFLNIINFMCYYLQLIRKADDAFLQVYLKSALAIAKYYQSIKKTVLPHANFLLMTLLTLEDKRIRNSKWIRLLIEELSKSPILFSQANNHFQFQNATIRAALNKNLLSNLSLAHIKINFFSEEEKLLIKPVLGTFELKDFNKESLIPLLKSAKLPEDFMKNHGEQFEKMIQNLPFEALQQCLIHFSMEPGVENDKMLLKIVSEFIQKMNNLNFDVLSVVTNIHEALNRISVDTLQKLLKSISELLSSNLRQFLLVDHHQILTFLFRYNVEASEYLSSVLDYALKNSKRGTALIDILYEISRSTLLPDPKIGQLSNVSMFNLSNYLKLLCLYEDSVPVLSLVSSAAKTQIELVPNSLLVRYIELKYKVVFRKRTDEEPLLALPNDLGKQFMMVIGDCGVEVKIEEIGDDRVFLLGNKVVVVFIDGHRTQEVRVIEKAMKQFYPERELIVKDAHLNRLDIEHFLQELGSGLSLSSNEVNTILTQWTSF